ncbi:hypothetical protein [Streptomyces olivaceiscleroticus]|uniref:Uncharacterized protein n=1 Tax=Streptomyces olivaceiscleroticus TaxID=68245 RepID=A0ABP3LEK9_9ACTN
MRVTSVAATVLALLGGFTASAVAAEAPATVQQHSVASAPMTDVAVTGDNNGNG